MWANSRQRHPAPQKFSANPANAPGWAVLPGNLPPASRQTPASDSTPILGWPSHRKSALVFALAVALALALAVAVAFAFAFLVVIPEGNLLLLLPLPLPLLLLLLFLLSFPKGICCCSCSCPCSCSCCCSSWLSFPKGICCCPCCCCCSCFLGWPSHRESAAALFASLPGYSTPRSASCFRFVSSIVNTLWQVEQSLAIDLPEAALWLPSWHRVQPG